MSLIVDNNMKDYIIEVYQTFEGKEPFTKWLESIKSVDIQLRVRKRLRRIELGNFGDYKSLGSGLFELRFSFGSGYRVYYTIKADKVIILLSGGDKSTQVRDIKKAKEYLEEINNETAKKS